MRQAEVIMLPKLSSIRIIGIKESNAVEHKFRINLRLTKPAEKQKHELRRDCASTI